ncbi:MAG: diguanylate cyclase [Zoogloeaceae bacterium]|nr:diguanylate cyclase [Zoogloeaceae bacterium]
MQFNETPTTPQAGTTELPPTPVLLLEDDSSFANDLKAQLVAYGYDTMVMNSACGLAEALSRHRPAALLVDVVLDTSEHITGPEIVRAARKAGLDLPPVFFISASNDVLYRLDAVRTGGAGYFVKPFEIGPLIEALDEATHRTQAEPYRVLVVDDSEATAEIHAGILRNAGMQVTICNNPLEVPAQIHERNPELVLLDMYMPACNGDELALLLRQSPATIGLPIVFLSVEENMDRQLLALHFGGDDFLKKPIEPHQLVWSVMARIDRYRKMRALMVRDGLTGLYNHSTLMEQLGRECSRAKRQEQTVSFAMLDLDHFKSVNDTHGHAAGDRVLKSFSRLLTQRLRKTDVIGRYGGEEFAVIFPDTDPATAEDIVNGIRETFGLLTHFAPGVAFRVTFSGGIAALPPCTSPTELSARADQLLYEAKAGGRNRIVIDA